MKRILTATLFSFAVFSFGQNYSGSTTFGDQLIDSQFDMAKDNAGNIYTCGHYNGSITLNNTVNYKGGNVDAFLAKFNAQGEPVYVKSFGSLVDEAVLAMTIDNMNNIYLTGYFGGSGMNAFDADPGLGVYTLESLGPLLTRDAFIIKLNSNGDFVWARQISNTYGGAQEDANTIKVDSNGNVFVAGTFSLADFNPSPTVSNEILSYNGGSKPNGFVLKLDSGGNYVWVKTFVSTGASKVMSMDIDSNDNLYIGGRFANIIDLDPGTPAVTSSANGGSDLFMAKWDNNGNYIWGKTFGGSASEDLGVLKILPSGLYVTGTFGGTVDFNPGTGTDIKTAVGTQGDAFLSKFDNLGEYSFTYTLGGSGNVNLQEGDAIYQSPYGTLYFAGKFIGTPDFDNSPTGVANTASNGNSDLFLLELTTSGQYLQHLTVGGDGAEINALVETTSNSDIFFAGSFNSAQIDLNPYAGTDLRNCSFVGYYDCFASKFSFPQLGTENNFSETNLNVYPNPVKDILTINYKGQLGGYKLFSALGQLVSEGSQISDNSINISGIQSGIYYLQLSDGNMTVTKKIVKN